MPGPGLDLVGDGELAEVADVSPVGRLSRYRPDADVARRQTARFPAAHFILAA